MIYTVAQLNEMSQEAFVQVLGSVFEETPAIAAQSWEKRPFTSVEDLYQTLVEQMLQMTDEEKLGLLRSHPDLGSRLKMAPDSVQEQAGVGLDRLTPQEYQQFQSLNEAYKAKFDIPFIMAVKGQTKEVILGAFERRLTYSYEREHQQALEEIAKIARFRLGDRLS